MITPEQIPPDVEEAAAKCLHDRADADMEHLSQGEFKPRPWETLSEEMRSSYFPAARAAIAAALNAWPGAVVGTAMIGNHLILPLPQEARDD